MIELFEHYLLEDCPYGDETTELLQIEGQGSLKIMSRDAGIAACADDLAEFYGKKGMKVTSYLDNGESFEEKSKGKGFEFWFKERWENN